MHGSYDILGISEERMRQIIREEMERAQLLRNSSSEQLAAQLTEMSKELDRVNRENWRLVKMTPREEIVSE